MLGRYSRHDRSARSNCGLEGWKKPFPHRLEFSEFAKNDEIAVRNLVNDRCAGSFYSPGIKVA